MSATHLTPAPAIWLSVAVAFVATISSGTYAVVTSISVIGLYVVVHRPGVSRVAGERIRRRGAREGRGISDDTDRRSTRRDDLGRVHHVILAIPDDMRAGKTIAALTAVLAVWYMAVERRRFRGPRFEDARLTGAQHSEQAVEARDL